ncbi:putative F-box protein [Raphanus sativus]|nr:putative F-box protein [Raphanus sativus]
MPNDLVLEIFSRLPAKSVAMCCCVSKLWASILNSQYFRELFLRRSSSHPRLLFAVRGYENTTRKWKFFSSPQPHYSLDKSSHHVVTADSHMKYSEDMQLYFCSYASGLMCCRQNKWIPKENEMHIVHVICNPSTGQYVLLPKLRIYDNHYGFSRSSLVFDPVNRQFKVLFLAHNVQRIITLGTGEMRWRNIQFFDKGICINGILYYLDFTRDDDDTWPQTQILVCFDVRSEKFKIIEEKEVVECFDEFLINYKGKLGGVKTNYAGETLQLRMWVLEDFKKQKLSEYVYNLPKNELIVDDNVSDVGMTARSEFVLLLGDYTSVPLYVFFFNPESNTLQTVEIQGFEGLRNFEIDQVEVFVDYVEDLRFDFMKTSLLPEQKLKDTAGTSTSSKDHLLKDPGTTYAATSTSPTEDTSTKPTGTSTSSKAQLQQGRGKFESINKFDALCLLDDHVDDLRFDVMKTSLPEQKPKQTSTSSRVDTSVKFSPINNDVSFRRPMHVAVSSNVFSENLRKGWYVSLCSLLVY